MLIVSGSSLAVEIGEPLEEFRVREIRLRRNPGQYVDMIGHEAVSDDPDTAEGRLTTHHPSEGLLDGIRGKQEFTGNDP